ncbi:LuxR C-terminal-related transcriptional regulator [Streptomyces canus]|uniref:LuxR C-terminal-related transcriptional regulator n=1 Tax=Streptomyces canus TaxID=58343 RepID=UPI0030E58ADD
MCSMVYGLAVEEGYLEAGTAQEKLGLTSEQAERAIETLRRLHLLRPMDGTGGKLVPVSPEVATAQLVTPVEIEIRDRRQAMEQTRADLSALMPLYFERRKLRRTEEAVDVLEDTTEVLSVLSAVSARCCKEVMTIQPGGGRPPKVLEEAFPRDEAMLQRGIKIRTLYQHTARFSGATRDYVRAMEKAGGEVRTVKDLFGRMLVFDREVVFIPSQDSAEGAILTREPSIVGFLCAFFDQTWRSAVPFFESLGEDISDDVKQSILQLLIDGHKDEVVARRMGLSVRTCRRHIAEIMQEIGAESRFQAGYLAAGRYRLER